MESKSLGTPALENTLGNDASMCEKTPILLVHVVRDILGGCPEV